MNKGTIKFFNSGKGFGFVTPDGGGADIFLPAATVTAAGVANVKPGQRVTFEQAPDKKGPKVVALQLLEEMVAKAPSPERVTVFCDPASDAAADVLDVIRAAGYQLQLVDCIAAPPNPEQLRHLSHLLSGSGQNLVRRHDPLFSTLQLDDRFIGDQEFWTAVVEHPSLINGPVLVLSGKARVCKTAQEAKLFFSKGGDLTPPKPKVLSPRIAALIRGESLAPAIPTTDDIEPRMMSQSPRSSSSVPPVAKLTEKPSRKVASKLPLVKASKKKAATKTVKKVIKRPK